MTPCMTTSSKCSSAPRRIAPTVAGRDCESPTGKNRAGNPRPRPHPFLALHGTLPVRPRARLLLAKRGAVRQSRRFLHVKRRTRRLWTIDGPPVRRNVARVGLAGENRLDRTRPRPRPLRARCSRLVRKEASGFFPRPPLCPYGAFTRVA